MGKNASFSEGGILDSGAYYQVTFNVRVNNGVETVRNKADIFAQSQNGEALSAESSVIIGSAGGPLAVKLLSFSGTLKNNFSTLIWVTESELNNDYFDVERSDDGVSFYKRGSVKGWGTTAITKRYQFDDNLNTNSPVVYYRLRIVDLDGKVSYSKIIALRLKGIANDQFSVYPNPFMDNLKISFYVSEDANAQYRIISFDGKEMIVRKVFLQKGTNIVVAKDLSRLASGNYILEINTGTEKYIKKIIKK